jgi:hypothetical protein
MKKRIFGRVLVAFLILTAGSCFMNLNAQEVKFFYQSGWGRL